MSDPQNHHITVNGLIPEFDGPHLLPRDKKIRGTRLSATYGTTRTVNVKFARKPSFAGVATGKLLCYSY